MYLIHFVYSFFKVTGSEYFPNALHLLIYCWADIAFNGYVVVLICIAILISCLTDMDVLM
jgi:hypothetical protein